MTHASGGATEDGAKSGASWWTNLVALLAITVLTAAGTWLLGWWAVPALAMIAGATMAGRSRASAVISAGAGLAWLVMLLANAMSGHLLALSALLGRIFPVPWPLLLVVTITYVMLLAWSAAVIGEAVRRAVKPLRAA